MAKYLNNMNVGTGYVMTLKKLANIICNEMNVGDIFSFGAEWEDEDKFVMDVGEISKWHGIYKFSPPFENNVNFIVLGPWAGKQCYSFVIQYENIEDIVENLRDYISDYTNGTTIKGYVCFDPENLRKDKKNED